MKVNISSEAVDILKTHLADYKEMADTELLVDGESVSRLVTAMIIDTAAEGDNLFEEYYPEE